MLVIGIDPGLTGAVAVLGGHGELVRLVDTPLLDGRYAINEMPHCLQGLDDGLAVLEEAQAMRGDGVVSAFKNGVGFGLWLGILEAFNIPTCRVRPADWKRTLHLTSDKGLSLALARRYYPQASLARKKDHGRAEALLLAYYGHKYAIN